MRLPYRRLLMNALVDRPTDRSKGCAQWTVDFLVFDAYDLSGAAAACAETTIAMPERPTADARVAALVSENAELQQRLGAAETRAHDMQATLQSVSQSQADARAKHGTHTSVQRTDFIGRCRIVEGLTRL